MLPYHTNSSTKSSSPGNAYDKIRSWIKLIISDSKSRSIFLFLVVNLSFAFVELIWGMWSNSLSLLSDSFHMFFDCTGLLCGLVASMITKWKPNDKFSYGYVRAEILAGFINGLFLVFIAFFIFSEAVERIFEPPDVHHDRLLVVSIIGFFVNILGIFVFHGHVHGHGHSHGDHGHSHGSSDRHYRGHSHDQNGHAGHGHSHDHSTPTQNGYVMIDQSPFSSNTDLPSQNHNHSHGMASDAVTSSDAQIMKGVFLHVLADTLGSVGVIVSAILMKLFGWMIVDPICSMIIASLIAMSVVPLIKESVCILMMRSPRSLDDVLSNCYQRVMCIEGVYGIQEPHFWTLCSDNYVGMVKLEVAPNCDPKYVTGATHSIFGQAGIRQIYVQLDYVST